MKKLVSIFLIVLFFVSCSIIPEEFRDESESSHVSTSNAEQTENNEETSNSTEETTAEESPGESSEESTDTSQLTRYDISVLTDLIDSAAAGDTVEIPEGYFKMNEAGSFANRLRLKEGMTLKGAGQGKTVIENAFISADGRRWSQNKVEISDISLTNDSGMEMRGLSGFRIHHVTIEALGGIAINVISSEASLIDNCSIDATNYGIVVTWGQDAEWGNENPSDIFGDWNDNISELVANNSEKAIFVEDCKFYNYHHAIVGHSNGHYVARYNVFYGGSKNGNIPGHPIDAHGPGYTGNESTNLGTRLVECYKNTIYGNSDYDRAWKAIAIRGGSAIIFDNHYIDWRNGVVLTLESRAADFAVINRPHDIWIWDNTHETVHTWSSDVFTTDNMNDNDIDNDGVVDTGVDAASNIREGQEYYLRAPSNSLDGFDHTWSYPHSLQGE